MALRNVQKVDWRNLFQSKTENDQNKQSEKWKQKIWRKISWNGENKIMVVRQKIEDIVEKPCRNFFTDWCSQIYFEKIVE